MNGWWWFAPATLLFLFVFLRLYTRVIAFRQQALTGSTRESGIVLGAALQGDQPSPALQERLDYALALYQEGRFSTFLCCGGSLRRQISEAQAMKRYLIERGIPAPAILLEENSVNTAQNLAFARLILERHHLRTCFLITHDYHMYRACLHARRQGIDIVPAPCASKRLWIPYHRVRECFALIRWFLLRP
ncbi:YdcF family protein [Desmospora activa]|uniref:Vancomycin permeability regulator SanA n=1 Tax=Desmospora activa DSM 45169 TaxID=1121389 RepID=A0A2T4Z6T7_9BACL|nr:YdcF family protein [Desmospora activa]PTM57597.1 vancomycin permeability regulator SanA [Desmospora activa DSM 45169]